MSEADNQDVILYKKFASETEARKEFSSLDKNIYVLQYNKNNDTKESFFIIYKKVTDVETQQ